MKTVLLLLAGALIGSSNAFVVVPAQRAAAFRHLGPLFALPGVDTMRISEIRQELESYGVSTKAFLEKREMVDALNKARAEGKTPKKEAEPAAEAKNGDNMSREDRIKAEMEKAKKMRVGDLKKELQARGVSTKSFFEKTEFVKAYAEAVVDAVNQKKGGGGSAGPAPKEEAFDASYRDVSMQKFDKRDPRLSQSRVIDVRLGK
jgi:hypothetical protein